MINACGPPVGEGEASVAQAARPRRRVVKDVLVCPGGSQDPELLCGSARTADQDKTSLTLAAGMSWWPKALSLPSWTHPHVHSFSSSPSYDQEGELGWNE